MPKSKVRNKPSYTGGGGLRTPGPRAVAGPSNPVYVAVMLGMMLIGLLWLVVNYLAGPDIPFMASLGAWNFLIGFGFMVVGLLMTMRWR